MKKNILTLAMGTKTSPEHYKELSLGELYLEFEIYGEYVERHKQMVKQMQSKR